MTPKYRKHTIRNKGFAQYRRKREYFPGAYKSPESLAAYRAFLQQHGLDQPRASTPAVIVNHIVNSFIAWANATYPPGCRSEAANCRAAMRHLLRLDKATLVAQYGPKRLKALQQALADKGKSRRYINAVCSRIKRAFKWAASEELVPASVYHALATVPGLREGRTAALEREKRMPVAWEHVEAILFELSPTVRQMVLLQWHTGVRPQSICMARASQFDRSQKPWVWKPKHKTEHLGHDLVVYIGPKAQKVIASLFDGRDFLFAPKHQNGKRAKGFRSFYDAVSYLRAISRAIDRVNRERDEANQIPHWTPHQLRHARATAVREKYGLEAAQAALGHSRIEATQIYAQRQRDLAKRIARETG